MNGRKHLCIALFLGIIVAACTPVSKKALRAYAETKEDVSVVADTPTAQQDEPSGRDGDDTQADGEVVRAMSCRRSEQVRMRLY